MQERNNSKEKLLIPHHLQNLAHKNEHIFSKSQQTTTQTQKISLYTLQTGQNMLTLLFSLYEAAGISGGLMERF